MVGVVDYGMGNLSSVVNALEFVGAEVQICRHSRDFDKVSKIVLPGVGAFADCMKILSSTGISDLLETHVVDLRKPTLGICLGMQIMARIGHEFGRNNGLGWFDAEVHSLQKLDDSVLLPNIGWDEITQVHEHVLFDGIENLSDFYLVHSFFVECEDSRDVLATYKLNESVVTAAIIKDNIFATQFHPEKSQDSGLRLLSNFIKWQP